MKLSLVIPTYKKEKEITKQLTRLTKFLDSRNISHELIVVIDGILDNTLEKVETLVKENNFENIKVYSYAKNRGKGYAVRYGMKKAQGDIVGFIDADLDIKIKSLEVALKAINNVEVDVVTPSKYLSNANVETSLKRRILSAGLKLINATILGQPKNVQEVSCGLKLFKKASADIIFPNLTVDRFAIDSELFYWVKYFKLNVAVVPFYMEMKEGSTSTKLREIVCMLKDIVNLSIKLRLDKVSLIMSNMANFFMIEAR